MIDISRRHLLSFGTAFILAACIPFLQGQLKVRNGWILRREDT